MKRFFEHNLSFRLVAALVDVFPGSRHVRDLGMATADDDAIWDYARQHGFAIASKDTDFYHRSMLFGQPPKVVWIRLGNCSTAQIEALLRSRDADLLAFDQDSSASFLALA